MSANDGSHALPGVLVGREIDAWPPRYYVAVQSEPSDKSGRTVRELLEAHADDLELQLRSLRLVLASEDPEQADRYLLDGIDVAVAQVVLRPRPERATVVTLTQGRLPRIKSD